MLTNVPALVSSSSITGLSYLIDKKKCFKEVSTLNTDMVTTGMLKVTR